MPNRLSNFPVMQEVLNKVTKKIDLEWAQWFRDLSQWVRLHTTFGYLLFGDCDNFALSTIAVKLVNWFEKGVYGLGSEINIDAPAGEVTIVESGVYRVSAIIQGALSVSGSGNQVFTIINVNGGDNVVEAYDITSANLSRTFSGEIIMTLSKDDVVSLFVQATANLGTFIVDTASLEIQELKAVK